MSKTAKFAGARVVFTFAVEDEEGDVDTYSTQEIVVTSKDWRQKWSSEGSSALIAQAVAQIESNVAETNGHAERI